MSETARRLAQKQPSFKKCVTAYLSRLWALKMDGAKLVTDTIDYSKEYVVGRRSGRTEAPLKGDVDLLEMRILAVVRS